MKPYATGRFGTDTATLVIFDPLCLAARIDDTCDWWSDPEEEIKEINQGNVLFVALGADGGYEFEIYRLREDEEMPPVQVSAIIRTLMGSFYVGAGEEVVAEGLGPGTQYGGVLFSLPSGTYKVGVAFRAAESMLSLFFKQTNAEPRNSFSESPAVA